MERRLLSWFVASTLFLTIYMTLNVMFGPPPAPNQPAADAMPGAAAVANAEAGEPAAETETPPAATAQPGGEPAESEKRPTTPTLFTLGSMDPASGYHLLATFNSRGGAVERLELTERTSKGGLKYRRVDTSSGYLGYLSPQTRLERDGCLVRVVGPGTPAALAKPAVADQPMGLQVGDRIVAVGGRAISSAADLESNLASTRPGQELSIEVIRAGAGETPLVLTTTLSEHPLDLLRLSSQGGADEILGNLDRLSCLVTLSQLGERILPTGSTSIAGLGWISQAVYDHEVKREADTDNQAVFTLPLPASKLGVGATGDLKISRSYTLKPNSYLIDMDIRLQNLGDQPQRLAYRLEAANGLTLEGWWYSTKISPNFLGGAAARDIVYQTVSARHRLLSGYDLLKRAKSQPKDADTPIFGADEPIENRSLTYAGIDAQYFAVALLPPEGTEHFTNFSRAAATVVADANAVPVHQERAVNVSFFVDSIAADVPPDASLRQSMRLFAGPKQPELLESLGLSDLIEYGWFGAVSRFLGQILHGLNSMTGNYGVAIILLTCLVRFCLFPVSRNAAVNAQRMQELAPELKRIAEKYKDDMEGRMRAQREFQKRVGFNPLAGCLPALLQLPIFIGLYRTLSIDLELRQAPFMAARSWASNLAGPDMLAYWGDWLWDYLSGRGTGWLGPFFNILPVFVVILFLIQQKMFMPPPTDEQTAMTQKIMTIMTMMMAIFFFRVPAGLCIYFITSSLWGIAERIIVKRTLPAAPLIAAAADGGVVEGTVTSAKSSPLKSLTDRIREQVNPEPAKALPPSKRKRPTGKR